MPCPSQRLGDVASSGERRTTRFGDQLVLPCHAERLTRVEGQRIMQLLVYDAPRDGLDLLGALLCILRFAHRNKNAPL